jgi:hypothetical protein
MEWWKRNKARFEELQREYGKIALITYLVLWAGVIGGFAAATVLGFEVDGVDNAGGILFGSWVAAKVTQPFRIAATIALTPVVAKVLRREPKGQPAAEDA